MKKKRRRRRLPSVDARDIKMVADAFWRVSTIQIKRVLERRVDGDDLWRIINNRQDSFGRIRRADRELLLHMPRQWLISALRLVYDERVAPE
jgi:hypothetical protein